jgi:ABC-type multidrug transport system ATPase subunit
VLYYKPLLLINPLPLTQFISAMSTACNALRCPQVDALWTNYDILFPIIAMYVNALLYLILGLYFDAVLPQPWGISKNIFFPITWIFGSLMKKLSLVSISTDLRLDREDEDVTVERNKVLGENAQKNEFNSPVLIRGLSKTYNRRKTALHELTIAMDNDECFGLLGPNGAGKSTTISMLCGLFGPSQGTAFVNGFNIRTDIDSVHLALGLCPQFDIQWDDLTVGEHLEFYARMKNMPLLEETKNVKQILESVGLWEKRNRTTGSLSGGMKRRLSIAIAFVGDPKIVMLDEPTTGLDPTSKRHLWDAILKSKKGKCIILTTHSMEEADVLCDRIGIVCRGRLQCVASSQRLKNKFGEGFNLGINFKEGCREQAVAYISSIIPEATIHVEFKTNIIYEIEKQYVKVSKIFKQIESEKDNVGISDWALSQTTLEDVFLNIVRRDEEEYERELAEEKRLLDGGLRGDAMFDPTKKSEPKDLEMQDAKINVGTTVNNSSAIEEI